MTPTEQIDSHINNILDWRHDVLVKLREVVNSSCTDLEESWKWSTPVWVIGKSPVCAISSFKDHVKINFFNGSLLTEFQSNFNSGLDSKQHRSINFSQNDKMDLSLIQKIVKAAVNQIKQPLT